MRGTVKVRRRIRLFTKGGMAFRLPKGKRDREIPLPNSVRDEIAAHFASYPAHSVTLPWGTVEGKPVTAALVLTTPEGNALNRSDFNRRVWAPAPKEAGVQHTRDDGSTRCATSSPPCCWTRARTSKLSESTRATVTPDSRCGPTHI